MTCDEKWILYNNPSWPAQWLAQEAAPKHFPKPNLHQKRSWSLVFWSYSFLNPSETIASERSILSKSMRGTENCKDCRQHWSTERAQFFSTTTPDHTLHNSFSKVEQIGLWSFASSTIFTWPLTNRLPLLQESWQLFSGKMLPQPTKSSFNPEAWTFMLQE